MGNAILKDERGQAMVEFALVAPLLALFLYAIIQFGLILYGFISIEQAARVGVRYASLGDGIAAIGQAITGEVSGIGLSASATTAQYQPPFSMTRSPPRSTLFPYTTTTGSTPTVVITIAYRYPVLIPLLGQQNIELQQSLTMAQEDPPSNTLSSATEASPAMYYGPSA
jgi:Flp pilus assembly protein TadG